MFPRGLPGIPAAGRGATPGSATPTTRSAGSSKPPASTAGSTGRCSSSSPTTARVYGRAQIPRKTYEIPCLIWAPNYIKPPRADVLASQIDIAPTVLGPLGLGYRAPFFGQDRLGEMTGTRVPRFNRNHDVALYQDGKLVVLGMQRRVMSRAYDNDLDAFAAAARVPDRDALAIGYFQTASDLCKAHRYE